MEERSKEASHIAAFVIVYFAVRPCRCYPSWISIGARMLSPPSSFTPLAHQLLHRLLPTLHLLVVGIVIFRLFQNSETLPHLHLRILLSTILTLLPHSPARLRKVANYLLISLFFSLNGGTTGVDESYKINTYIYYSINQYHRRVHLLKISTKR